jgi:hypothetical protein
MGIGVKDLPPETNKHSNLWPAETFLAKMIRHYTQKQDWIWQIGAANGKMTF